MAMKVSLSLFSVVAFSCYSFATVGDNRSNLSFYLTFLYLVAETGDTLAYFVKLEGQ